MYRHLIILVALATLATAEAPRPRLIDFNPWAWLPTSRNRSPSIMDYFFPPSRTPKNSNLNPENIETTISDNIDDRANKLKVKTTPYPATVTAKVKKPKPTTTDVKITETNKITTTNKPTKHYTIMPLVRTTTEMVESTSADSTETADLESTITTVDGKETPTPTMSDARSTDAGTTVTLDSSTAETTVADAADSREGYMPLRDKPQPPPTQVKINDQTKKETVPLPAGSTNVLAKPTKYHYYPHNQHIYLLPECAIQQVCNAVYVRLNYTQPLCACPSRYRDPCSASLNADDLHTTRLTTDSKKKYAKKAVTLVKTCEAVSEMRECRAPRDWSLLALQNIRTGKSHYLVICRCPENHILEGPMSHDQPTYASVPGIRVYGMMCVKPAFTGYNANRYPSSVAVQSTTSAYKVDYSQAHAYSEKPMYTRYPSHGYLPGYFNRMSRVSRVRRNADYPPFPWDKVRELARSLHWID